jgi:uroporphyrin-III C-methyltransferase
MLTPAPGLVHFVGAGPGDPDLLTVKARALLERAEIVLHDDLVSARILSLAGNESVILNVGKRCGKKRITQADINSLMIAAARRGMDVVRLKSGDPAVFGRLAEEIDALAAAGIAYEIIPGITSGSAAAASLGISLTDRRRSSRVVFVSGHLAHGAGPREKNDWADAAREGTTLVIYMPGRDLAPLGEELMAAGLPADIPAAVVSRISTPQQRQQPATLGELGALAALEPPSIVLVGRAVAKIVPGEIAGIDSGTESGRGWDSYLDLLVAQSHPQIAFVPRAFRSPQKISA